MRLAVAYPTARRFRTGATLAMYCIVVLVIVLLTQISAIIHAGVDQAVTNASPDGRAGGLQPEHAAPESAPDLTRGSMAGQSTRSPPW